ncbi:helix-turn-helix transcriptional regulator [Bradyrhizobium japonicum]|uniref:helix-turn-helix transcriptional regulator n=1 Tax=Bradyrhizobium japonicum TaxID=375 RepID=UPI003511241D
MSKRIIRPKETQARLGIGHDKFWKDVKKGVLPPLVRLGPKSVGHVEEEIDAYIEGLMKQRPVAKAVA